MVPLHSSTSLKMCFLNVGGLKNKEGSKLEDLFFINKINKYDIVFLAETHIGYESNIHRLVMNPIFTEWEHFIFIKYVGLYVDPITAILEG